MLFVSKIEAMFFTSSVKWNRTINEKGCVIHIVFFAELRENRSAITFVLVGSSFTWSKSFELGSTAAYSQYCSSLS